MSNITPDKNDIKTFFHVVFSGCSGLIPCRSFAEKAMGGTKPPRNIWIEADDDMAINAVEFANLAAKAKTAFYVISGTVAKQGEAGSGHILQMQTLLIDIDNGDTEDKLAVLSDTLGRPTLIVESGGITEAGSSKLHVYWQLVKAVSGEELQKLVKLRHQIALSVGGDIHFKSAHQPIRVAGSIYHKGGTHKLVKIRRYEPVEYELQELVDGAGRLPHNKSDKGDVPLHTIPLKSVITSKVYEGAEGEATRFNHLQRVIGFWLRRLHDGIITEGEALEEITAYNEANVVPPWPNDKLQQSINSLWEKHVKENGKPEKTDSDCKIEAIDPTLWQGIPPEREWLIQGWLPRAYVTALYGDGGVGKSLLAQQLMTALSMGREFLGTKSKPCRVYALMCEDDSNELWRRQAAINEHYNINMSQLDNVRLVSRVGLNNLLMTFANDDIGKLTKFFEELHKDIASYKPDLVILDTAADLFGGNENNRPQVRQFIQTACGQVARLTDSAVLLCAHPSESGMQKGTGSGGSTAWNNTVRSRWYLKRPEAGELTDNHRILSRVKSNYSSRGDEEYLKWQDGVFISLDSSSCSRPITGKRQSERNNIERDRKTQLMLRLINVEAEQGRIYTMNQFAETFEDSKRNYYGFGSKRSINERLSIAATQGLIKFFNDPQIYGLDIRKSNYGYLCRDDTILKRKTVDSSTGEVTEELFVIQPTHHKLQPNGDLTIIENLQKNEVKND